MTRREKLEALQDKLIDELLSAEKLDSRDKAVAVSLLKNNKVVEEDNVISESDIIDDLIEEKK